MIIRPNRLDLATFTIADVPACPEPFRLINKVPIRDNGEPLVDLRETNPELSFGDYCLPYVRESVAQALRVASENTPEPLDLRVYTALRTLQQQADMYWGNYKRAREEHPTWPEATVRKMTNRFFAPPDAKAPPGHCTGAAVDVALLRRDNGEHLDLRSPLDGWKSAPTAVLGLDPLAAENRRVLCHIMHSTGLSNCRDEFWHWSYGDSAWAVRTGEPVSCYGLIEPPEGATRVTGSRLKMVPYNPSWPAQFEELRSLFGDMRVEHVGSTAVPGLTAKPILDIDIVVPDSNAMAATIETLKELGYAHQGDQGVSGREAFRAESEEAKKRPEHHLYACLEGNRELKRHLAFRDYLRGHPAAADDYGRLKVELAARYPWDRIRYNHAKEPFVVGILFLADPTLA